MLPPFDDYSMKNRTYRYAENNVLYPFGYGLTYSNVSLSGLSYDIGSRMAALTAENAGGYDTDEVIQLYIRDNNSKWAVPNYKLCGFKRIHINKGESQYVSIALHPSAFEVVDEDGRQLVDSDSFTLYAGVCQPDDLSRSLAGCETLSIDITFGR
jgi:beta-glucosidase